MPIIILLILILVLLIIIPIGIFALIKYFIRYNNQLKHKGTQQQEELRRMNLKDL